MTKRLFIYPVVMALFVIGCNKLGEQTSEPANQAETTQTAQVNNWLLGQWTSDYGEGFELMEACRRPDSQFGKKYVYWRDDVDGDPHEELNKVDEYLIDGNSIKMRIVPPTSVEPMIFKDGTMHFELQPEGWVKIFFPKREDEFVKMVRCESSPFPYSPDVAPTPPRYQGIEPGIVDQPRGET